MQDATECAFDLSLALLTKCKEVAELLQQLFTLALIKHPQQFDERRTIAKGCSLFAPIYRLKALTLNNMGCTFLKQNRVSEAYEYLRQTLEIEMQGNYSKNQVAQTSLNLCCVMSKMNKHKEALVHAQRAIRLFQEEIELLEKQSNNPHPLLYQLPLTL